MSESTIAEPGAASADLPADNPFAAQSDLPFGMPPFERIAPEHFRPAFHAGMARHRTEIDAIVARPGPATFEDTLEAMEGAGRLLGRVASVFFNLTSSHAVGELPDIEAEVAPLLSAHHDAIFLDRALYERVATIFAGRDLLPLDLEQRRLVERYHTDFVRAGAGLDLDAQDRLRAINTEISTLTTRFKAALMAGTNERAVLVDDPAELDGLGQDDLRAAAEAARARGVPGYLLTLVLPTAQPALSVLADRGLRERLHRASVGRGLDGEHDTRGLLTALSALRAERAALLGYSSHADYVVADQTAGSVEAVSRMLAGLVPAAVANARVEADELAAALLADGGQGPLQPWDWAFYAQRVRRERFEVDEAGLRPYFELGRVLRDGIFFAAGRLYGLTFRPRTDLPVYHPDVQAYEVVGDDGAPLGLFLADWYARDSKRGGAWMSTFVDQSHLLGDRPVVVINLNIPRPPDGEATLLTQDLVITAFHEFGHVLHGLLSDVRYPRLSGTSVPRDFVEFPSQVNEMWALHPEVLARYAVHHRTGEPLPAAQVERLRAAEVYGQGFATTEYLAAALLDLAWHSRPADTAAVAARDVEAFEREQLTAAGVAVDLVPPRYRSSYFSHVFAGGYSAGYYSYIWSEVLDADTVDWFTERGGLVREAGRTFARELLSRGGAVDPMAAFAAVRGRGPRVEPLLRRRGLQAAPAAGSSSADSSAADSSAAVPPAGPAPLQSGLTSLLGFDFVEAGPDRAVVRWQVTPQMHQPFGILHGGVYCAAVETVASVGAALWLGDRGHVVGVSNQTDFLRAVREGVLTATALPVHRGRSQQLWGVEIRDGRERLVAKGQVRLANLTGAGHPAGRPE